MVTEKSQKEWAEALQDLGADVTPETYMHPGEILGKDADAGVAMRVSSLAYKGYTKVYDTLTGIMSLQPRWLLWQTFAKLREDGTPFFTTKDPQIPPDHGQDLKCYLHVDSAEWTEFKGMGFASCTKQHIPHQDGKDNHARKSHKRFWEAFQTARVHKEREEDRELQRETNRLMQEAILRNVQVPEVSIPTVATDTGGGTFYIPAKHTHVYRGKKAGAPCKFEGCEGVRAEPARTRTRK